MSPVRLANLTIGSYSVIKIVAADSQLDELERGRQAHARLMSQCETLLGQVAAYSELGGDTSIGAEMKALREHLLGLLLLRDAQEARAP